MNEQLLEKAKELAARNYRTVIESDELSNGRSIFIARNLELEGCKSQGYTPEEARNNLDLARIDYIYSLLEDGIIPPEPIASETIETGAYAHIMTYRFEVKIEPIGAIDLKPIIEREIDIPFYKGNTEQIGI